MHADFINLSYAKSASTGALECLIELARDVIEKRHPHQEDEKRDTNLLAEGLRTLGHRRALEPFDELKDDLAAVENRYRQQV
jgi:hypothetical protein